MSKGQMSSLREEDNPVTSAASSSSHGHYPEWDPMKGMSESLLNSTRGNLSGDGVMGVFGGGGEMEVGSVLCPFNDGSGRCFKANCLYKHVPYSSKTLKELPKLQSAFDVCQQPSNIDAASLPPQMLPAEGCISKVVIVAAFDPGCFYVIPENGWKCLCKIHEDEDNEQAGKGFDTSWKSKQPRNFFDTSEEIHGSLKRHFQNHLTGNNRADFNIGELVAVRMSSTGGSRSWYRGKIVADPVCNDDDDIYKPVDVEVLLLDYGVSCVKSSLDIAALPVDFCRITPLAYKCQLFGISPILGTWSTAAAKVFRELVLERYCIAEVIRTALPTLNNSGSDMTSDSCFVNLRIKSNGDNYINVTQHLVESGCGLEWNMFPTQPQLNDILEGHAHKFALA